MYFRFILQILLNTHLSLRNTLMSPAVTKNLIYVSSVTIDNSDCIFDPLKSAKKGCVYMPKVSMLSLCLGHFGTYNRYIQIQGHKIRNI